MLDESDYTLHERKLAAALLAVGKARGHSPAECAEVALTAFEFHGLRDPLPLLWEWFELRDELPQPAPQFDRVTRQ